MRDSGYGAQLAELEEITIINASDILAPFMLWAQPDTAVDILAHLKHFTSYITDETEIDLCLAMGWNNFYVEFSKMNSQTNSCQAWHKAVSSARHLIESGHVLQPFG